LLLLVTAGCGSEPIAGPGAVQEPPTQSATNHLSLPAQPRSSEPTDSVEAISEGEEIAPQSREAEPGTAASENSFLLYLSRDFGRENLDSCQVGIISSGSLLDYMKEEWQISTGYGGGFVQGINGLTSSNSAGIRSDWFFYINGIGSPAGADQITPSPGSIVWWDYHDWNSGPGQAAVIGCYPQPFKKSGVTLVTTQRWMELAQQCRKALGTQGIGRVDIADLHQDVSRWEQHTGPVLVIGTWIELRENSYLEKWNQAYSKNGSGIHFDEDGIELLGVNGTVQQTWREGAGVIVASGQGLGDESPLWLVAGFDDPGVEAAARVLCSQPEELKYKYGIAVQGGKVLALPSN